MRTWLALILGHGNQPPDSCPKTFHAVQPEVVLTWSIEAKYSNTAALNLTG